MKKRTILVVEDEGLIAADLQRRLEKMGYRVPEIAFSGTEALQFARSIPFDLALMDIRLKGNIDGIDTAKALKTELQVPVVYITALSDAETVHRAMDSDPLGYMLKPIADAALHDTVQAALNQQDMRQRLGTDDDRLSQPEDYLQEVNFLRYRLDVVKAWPESAYKQTVLQSILTRLEAVAASANARRAPEGKAHAV